MSSDPAGQIIKILSAVQSWDISVGKAAELLTKIFTEESIEDFSHTDNGIFDSNEWEAIVVDEISCSWPKTVKYSFSSVRSGDKVLLLRKKI